MKRKQEREKKRGRKRKEGGKIVGVGRHRGK
jgi:hypothetical protein